MLWLHVTVLASLATLVTADIEFTSPKADESIKGGGSISIEWKDSGDTPPLSDLVSYDLILVAGGNDGASQFVVKPIVAGAQFLQTGNTAGTGAIGVDLGDSTKNAYFIKIVSTSKTGDIITNYSKRFSMSGMTGKFPQNVIDGLKTVKGSDGPAREEKSGANPADPAGGDFDQLYTMQTGPTRYAPMQPVPPTKITKKDRQPMFPTSSVIIATTNLPIPKQQTTITRSQTFSVSSRVNTAAPAPDPSDDMAKYLARWKD